MKIKFKSFNGLFGLMLSFIGLSCAPTGSTSNNQEGSTKHQETVIECHQMDEQTCNENASRCEFYKGKCHTIKAAQDVRLQEQKEQEIKDIETQLNAAKIAAGEKTRLAAEKKKLESELQKLKEKVNVSEPPKNQPKPSGLAATGNVKEQRLWPQVPKSVSDGWSPENPSILSAKDRDEFVSFLYPKSISVQQSDLTKQLPYLDTTLMGLLEHEVNAISSEANIKSLFSTLSQMLEFEHVYFKGNDADEAQKTFLQNNKQEFISLLKKLLIKANKQNIALINSNFVEKVLKNLDYEAIKNQTKILIKENGPAWEAVKKIFAYALSIDKGIDLAQAMSINSFDYFSNEIVQNDKNGEVFKYLLENSLVKNLTYFSSMLLKLSPQDRELFYSKLTAAQYEPVFKDLLAADINPYMHDMSKHKEILNVLGEMLAKKPDIQMELSTIIKDTFYSSQQVTPEQKNKVKELLLFLLTKVDLSKNATLIVPFRENLSNLDQELRDAFYAYVEKVDQDWVYKNVLEPLLKKKSPVILEDLLVQKKLTASEFKDLATKLLQESLVLYAQNTTTTGMAPDFLNLLKAPMKVLLKSKYPDLATKTTGNYNIQSNIFRDLLDIFPKAERKELHDFIESSTTQLKAWFKAQYNDLKSKGYIDTDGPDAFFTNL